MAGAHVAIDLANSASFEDKAVLEFDGGTSASEEQRLSTEWGNGRERMAGSHHEGGEVGWDDASVQRSTAVVSRNQDRKPTVTSYPPLRRPPARGIGIAAIQEPEGERGVCRRSAHWRAMQEVNLRQSSAALPLNNKVCLRPLYPEVGWHKLAGLSCISVRKRVVGSCL
jgi:hypothetical protein